MNDRRLLACAELCKGSKAVDVGTDHGHLAAHLVMQGLCENVVACDINEKPLMAAKDTVKRLGLEDKIQTVISDGLDEISPDGITDVFIAGMGGELIADIISRAEWLKSNKVNLVLQPMTKWDHLRKWLYEQGFEVKRELPCEDGRFVYSVMQAEYIGRKPDHECDIEYLYIGRVDADSASGRKYLTRQAERLETAANGMMRSPDKKQTAEEMLAAAARIRNRLEKYSGK